MMDALSVATQLRDLASEPQNREAIAKDEGCLPGLVLFLDHKDPEVVFRTLQTLSYLAEQPQNVRAMANELGLMQSLEALMETCSNKVGGDMAALAKEVYRMLSTPARAGPLGAAEQHTRKSKAQFFINSADKKAKTVTLHIQGLDGSDERGVCEAALLKVKGVISFTFQMALKRCTVRVRADLPTESLALAIAATNVLSAEQVVKNESGEEILVPLHTAKAQTDRDLQLPDYLPEEDSPEKEASRAVSRTTTKQDGGKTWLSSATSFLSKTFYW